MVLLFTFDLMMPDDAKYIVNKNKITLLKSSEISSVISFELLKKYYAILELKVLMSKLYGLKLKWLTTESQRVLNGKIFDNKICS